MFAAKNEFFTPSQSYQISRSVRLRSSASAYFNRTQTAGSQTTWTWSGWVKRGKLGTSQYLMQAGGSSGSGVTMSVIADDFQIETGNGTTQYYARSTAQYRDPSAWYHVVMVCNTTSATSTLTGTPSDRLQIWVNGVQVTSFSASSIPTQNFAGYINQNTVAANIGRWNGATPNYYFDGYLTEVNFIDGQALTPTSFGQFNSVTGVWQPLKYTGTYGTNGFYLNFSDNSAATAAAIGKDYSGNGNNWTPNNISVTSGVTYDSMLDVPTPYADGGNGRGNYAVLNPLVTTNAAPTTFSEANLRVDFGSSSTGWAHSSIGVSTGKWYAEFTLTSVSSTNATVGLKTDSSINYAGFSSNSYAYQNNGNKVTNDVGSAYGASFTNGDVIGMAYDADAGTLTFYKNNVSQGQAFSGITGTNYFVVSDSSSAATCVWQVNFGQRPFTYTPPTGFVALNTQNLPAPTISNGANYMTALLWTSTASIQTVTGAAFKPDLVWVKSRASASANEGYHHVVDSVRGVCSVGGVLYTNTTDSASWIGTNNSVTAFNSNGFSSGIYDGLNGNAMVTWLWNAGSGTTSSNTSGSITSTVSVNATAGFSIVTYTGTGANATVGHGLGVAPSMIIIKCRGSATDPSWIVGHVGVVMGTGRLILNGTDANSNAGAASLWNSTAATSTVFSLGNYSSVNQSTLTYVAYCFSAVRGYSAFGSYTGNGSTDGPFVFLGFRPRWVMIKRTDTAGNNWVILDTSRDTYNASGLYLYPNLSAAEDDYRASTGPMDILSNGFKQRSSLSNVNASGATYIYACFAENPFKLALAR